MNSAWVVMLSTLVLAAPLMLAAMGGLTSERSGVMNIALEGLMLTSACITALVSTTANSAWVGALCGTGAAIVLAALHWSITQHYRIDHIISGMALNLLALGGTNFLYTTMPDRVAPAGGIPSIPALTLTLSSGARPSLTPFLALAFAAPLVISWYFRRTRPGLRLTAVGNDPDKARLAGINPLTVRLWALIATGGLTGLAGAMLASNASRFTDNMTAGRGYIALAALIVGGWRPIPAALACLAFAMFDALQLQFQGTHLFGADVPSEVWASLPYLVTIVALAGFLGKSRAPLGLGKP